MEFRQFVEQTNSYDKYVQELSDACSNTGHSMVSIGAVDGQTLYSVIMNPKGKNTIAFFGSIHGNEIAGAYSILEYIKTIKPYPNVRIFALPLINAYGFNRDVRTGFGKRDLNRQWLSEKPQKNESGLIREAIEKENIQFVHSIHEDRGAKGFYLYYWTNEIKDECKSIVHLAEQFMPRDTRKVIYGDEAKRGLILCKLDDMESEDESCLETWLWKKGINNICTETPSKLPLEKRVKCNVEIMKFLADRFQ